MTALGRVRAGVALGLLSTLAAGCVERAPVEPDRWRIAQRLIPVEPALTFDRTRLYDPVRVLDWRFDAGGDGETWNARPAAAATRTPRGWTIEGSVPAPRLVRGVALDAARVEAFEVDVAGLRQGPLRWFWRRSGEEFVADRGLIVRGDPQAGDDTVTHTLAVAGHADWSGTIERLRLDPTMTASESVRIEAIRGIRYQAPAGLVASAAAKPWKVDLDHELASALLAPPGTPVERRVEVPRRGRLRFSYGVSGRVHVPLTFTVHAQAGRSEPELLFQATLDPALDDTGVWRQGTADLTAFGKKTVSLILEAVAEGAWDRSSGMPAFANPEILQPGSSDPRPDVLLVSIDTLRADHLSTYGYERQTSPNLDAWAARAGIVFENAVVSAPWTLPSHVSLLSGLDADRHGVNHGQAMPAGIPTLAERLRDAGYRTLAVTGGGWMRPDYGFDRGFDVYRYWPAGVDKEDELDQGTATVERWLDQRPRQPLFVFFHTFEVHSPHRRRQPFFGRLTGSTGAGDGSVVIEQSSTPREEGYLLRKSFFWHRKGATPRLTPVAAGELQEVVDRYDSAIALTDDRLGRLLGRAAGTMVVVTSDHGDAFGEKGLASHGYLYDFNLLVPLIVALPDGAGAGRRVREQVRSVDVVPTLLDLLGLPLPGASEIDGVSLRALLEGRGETEEREAWSYAASSNRGISVRLANRRKYILNHTPWPPLMGREELYDLRADPNEEVDLAGSERVREIRQRVVRRLVERLAGLVIHARNDTEETLQGVLRGAAVRGFRLKALAPEGTPLSWADTEPGVARFTIPPGGLGSYVIEGAGAGSLGVEVSLSGGAWSRAEVDGADLDQPWQLSYAGGAWKLTRTAEPASDTAVTVSRRGAAGGAVEPAAIDPRLRDELRALGYLP